MIVRKDRDAKFTALALVIGRPDLRWADWEGQSAPGRNGFQLWITYPSDEAAIRTIFSEGEVGRLGIKRIMRDYARWYKEQEQEHATDQSGS